MTKPRAGRHPQDLGEAEISAFLSHLAADRQVSASTQNLALSALLFLYRTVLGRELGRFPDYARPKRRRKLPVVLTQESSGLAEAPPQGGSAQDS